MAQCAQVGWLISASKQETGRKARFFRVLRTTYGFQGGALAGLTVGAATRWQDRTSVSNSAATLAQQGYALLDLMARYQVDRHLSFSVNVNNALDKKYLAGMTNFSAVGLFYTWGAPRSVNVGMRYDF